MIIVFECSTGVLSGRVYFVDGAGGFGFWGLGKLPDVYNHSICGVRATTIAACRGDSQ